MHQTLLLWLLLFTTIQPSFSSKGDQQPEYQSCVNVCIENNECQQTITYVYHISFFPWPCKDECRYQCMRKIEFQRQQRREPVLQYHGKWPFIRIWGCQEPFSALFSLSNMAPNIYYVFKTDLFAPKDDDITLRRMLIASCFIAMNTWWWSFVYHSKETDLTEKLDYNFATLHMATFLQMSVIRVIYEFDLNRLLAWLSAFLLLIFVAYHIWFLNFVDFDYGYNTRIMSYVIVSQLFMWFAWFGIIRRRFHHDAQHASMIIKFQLTLVGIVSLELLDFPPIGNHIDAHSLWHCFTCPLTIYWYKFLIADAKWRRSRRKEN
jgi:hypothetical protein